MSASTYRGNIGESRLNGMIFVSLLLHGLLLFLLFFAPSFPSPKLTFGPIYTVSLVDSSEAVFAQGGDTASAEELLGAAMPTTALKKNLVQEPLNLSRSPDSAGRDETLEKAIEEIRKRAEATPKEIEQPAPLNKSSLLSPLSPADLSAKIGAYKMLIRSRIKGKWSYVQGIPPGEQWEASVDIRILHDGAVADTAIVKGSGNRLFDESVLKAIRKASPFPPLPEWFTENSLEMGIRFLSSELKS